MQKLINANLKLVIAELINRCLFSFFRAFFLSEIVSTVESTSLDVRLRLLAREESLSKMLFQNVSVIDLLLPDEAGSSSSVFP